MNYFLGIRRRDNVLVADFEDTVNGGNHAVIGSTAVNGVWHHAAVTYDTATDTWNCISTASWSAPSPSANFTPGIDEHPSRRPGHGPQLDRRAGRLLQRRPRRGPHLERRAQRTPRSCGQRDQELTSGTGLIAR